MEQITSKQNPKFKYWLSLLSSKGLKNSEHYLMAGAKWIQEALENHPETCATILLPPHEFAPNNLAPNISVFSLSKELFESLDIFGTYKALLLLHKPKLEPWSQERTPQGLELLCPLGDPSNMGSLLRNAAAFGVKNLILLEEACSPFHPKAVRTAAGNLHNYRFFQGPSIRDLIPQENVYSLHSQGCSLKDFSWPEHLYLLVGEEGPGIPSVFHQSRCISIPMESSTESLNAYFATSLALYDHYAKSRP